MARTCWRGARLQQLEVVDLGVMVPCDRILQTQSTSGPTDWVERLITPSLDEMVFVAGRWNAGTSGCRS